MFAGLYIHSPLLTMVCSRLWLLQLSCFFFFALLIQPKTLAVNGTPRIAPASLWTRPKVQEFIQHVKSDPSSVLVVGRGETMTVRVPTHEGGE